MRDPKRIDSILQAVGELWKKYPDLRFCQLVQDIVGPGDHFYLEDDEFCKRLMDFESWLADRQQEKGML